MYSPFNGATDIGFGPNGHVFITDGYGNARVLEYTATGELVKKWGMRGSGPGEFNLPHSLQIDKGIIYIADRENGRIESFELSGQYLGQIRPSWADLFNQDSRQCDLGIDWTTRSTRRFIGWLAVEDR